MSEDIKVTRNKEDYLEAISELSKDKGFARVKDVAAKLGVKPSSVTEMVRKLDGMGYLKYEKYGMITLTNRGEDVAGDVISRHETIKRFLLMILVPEVVADESACIIEHNIDAETFGQIRMFVEFMEKDKSGKAIIDGFVAYCNDMKRQEDMATKIKR